MPQKFTSYALLGSGRVARHLQFYLQSLGLPFTRWSRSERQVPLKDVVAGASHVLLAVSDRAIAEVAGQIPSEGKTLVHFSGATHVDGVHAAHPLMTFTAELQPPEWYRGIPFVIERGPAFSDLLPGLPNPHFALAEELRPLYHALVSLTGNSSYLLWRNTGDEFERKLGLPRTLLGPFLHQVVENAMRTANDGFTGPVARGDWQTVSGHLRALKHSPLENNYVEYLNSAARAGHPVPKEML